MSKITLAILVTAMSLVGFVSARAVDRRDRLEDQRIIESANQKAEKAEQRAEAYRRQLSGGTIPAMQRLAPERAPQPDPWTAAPAALDSTMAELRSLLSLSDEQTVRLQGLYEKQLEAAKEIMRSGRVPAISEDPTLEKQTRSFLSEEQSRKFAEYLKSKAEVDGRKIADTQAEQFKAPLGLRDEQVPLVADALYRLYSAPAGSVAAGALTDKMSDLLQPVLSKDQLQTFLSMIGSGMPH